MRALVTGGTGFVGAHLLRCLIKEKAEVAVLIRRKSNPWRIADILSHVEIIQGDLTDIELAKDNIRLFRPDVTFHLGWYGVSNRYRNDPAQVQNLDGSLSLLRVCKECGCEVFVGMGSQAEYGPYDAPIAEDFETRLTTVYGVTKLCVSLLAQQLCENLGLRFVWLRLFSSYGPMEDSGWLIPYVVLTLMRGHKPSLTLGEQQWDYLYVADAAEAIYQVALKSQAQGVFNLGSGEIHTIRSIVERIRDMIDPALRLGLGEVSYLPDQVMHLQADISKLQSVTGWKPKIGIDEGLRRTVEWYRNEQL